jgi:hypothetical protein
LAHYLDLLWRPGVHKDAAYEAHMHAERPMPSRAVETKHCIHSDNAHSWKRANQYTRTSGHSWALIRSPVTYVVLYASYSRMYVRSHAVRIASWGIAL